MANLNTFKVKDIRNQMESSLEMTESFQAFKFRQFEIFH